MNQGDMSQAQIKAIGEYEKAISYNKSLVRNNCVDEEIVSDALQSIDDALLQLAKLSLVPNVDHSGWDYVPYR